MINNYFNFTIIVWREKVSKTSVIVTDWHCCKGYVQLSKMLLCININSKNTCALRYVLWFYNFSTHYHYRKKPQGHEEQVPLLSHFSYVKHTSLGSRYGVKTRSYRQPERWHSCLKVKGKCYKKPSTTSPNDVLDHQA